MLINNATYIINNIHCTNINLIFKANCGVRYKFAHLQANENPEQLILIITQLKLHSCIFIHPFNFVFFIEMPDLFLELHVMYSIQAEMKNRSKPVRC